MEVYTGASQQTLTEQNIDLTDDKIPADNFINTVKKTIAIVQDENEKHDWDNENDLENQAAQLSDRIEGIRLKDVDISKMAKSMYLRETDERMMDQLNGRFQ